MNEEMEATLQSLAGMRILDRMLETSAVDPLYSFALDEWLCRQVGQGAGPVCHLWRHPAAFIMGLRDSRLPYAREAQDMLEKRGWQTAVRNSGGAAVPLDLGVVNISLILPKTGMADKHFHSDFERMYRLIAQALAGTGKQVDKGEIAGSYCPGDYDLSIGGYKFCGIAQRRQTAAYIVQAFVIVEGNGAFRAEAVQDFYAVAAEGANPGTYPAVEPDRMASLEQLAGLAPGSASAFAEAVKQVLIQQRASGWENPGTAELTLPTDEEVHQLAVSLRSRYTVGPASN